MTIVAKSIPMDLNPESNYIVRLRSLNAFGVTSDWSESLVVNTTPASLSSAQRFIITADGMVAYNINGQMIFYYSSTPAIRVNLIRNPSFEINNVGWDNLAQTSSNRTTTDFFVGEPGMLACLRVIANPTLPALIAINVGIISSSTRRIPVTPGLPYTLSLFAKVPSGQDPVELKVGFRFYNSGGGLISESVNVNTTELASNQSWVRLNHVAINAPAGAVTLGVVVKCPDPMDVGQYYHIDGVMVEQSTTLRDYFDGSTSAGTSYWNTPLAPHDSTSSLDTLTSYSVNGGVFTESTIQTSRNVNITGGVVMDINGLRGYSTTGVNVFNIDTVGNVTVTGIINATGGNFKNAVTVGQAANKITIVGAGTAGGTKIYSGTGTYANVNTPFYMDAAGRFSLGSGLVYDGINLALTGTINASSGHIGGWDINTSYLQSASGSVTLGLFGVNNYSFASVPVEGMLIVSTITDANALEPGAGIYFQDPVNLGYQHKIQGYLSTDFSVSGLEMSSAARNSTAAWGTVSVDNNNAFLYHTNNSFGEAFVQVGAGAVKIFADLQTRIYCDRFGNIAFSPGTTERLYLGSRTAYLPIRIYHTNGGGSNAFTSLENLIVTPVTNVINGDLFTITATMRLQYTSGTGAAVVNLFVDTPGSDFGFGDRIVVNNMTSGADGTYSATWAYQATQGPGTYNFYIQGTSTGSATYTAVSPDFFMTVEHWGIR